MLAFRAADKSLKNFSKLFFICIFTAYLLTMVLPALLRASTEVSYMASH